MKYTDNFGNKAHVQAYRKTITATLKEEDLKKLTNQGIYSNMLEYRN